MRQIDLKTILKINLTRLCVCVFFLLLLLLFFDRLLFVFHLGIVFVWKWISISLFAHKKFSMLSSSLFFLCVCECLKQRARQTQRSLLFLNRTNSAVVRLCLCECDKLERWMMHPFTSRNLVVLWGKSFKRSVLTGI